MNKTDSINSSSTVISHKKDGLALEFIFSDGFVKGIAPSGKYHFHALYEIHIPVSGSLSVILEEGDITVSKGEVCIIPPGVAHNVLPDPTSFCTGFRFGYETSSRDAEKDTDILPIAFSSLDKPCVICSDIYEKYLLAASKCIKSDLPEFMAADLLFLSVYELAILLSRDAGRKKESLLPEAKTSLSERIENFINDGYASKITVNDLALHLSLGKRQTQRIVLSLFSMTFTALLNKKRLTAAKFLLKTTDESIESIAFRCGFEDKSYFYRRFTSFFGITPAKYRLETQNKTDIYTN